MILKLPIPGLRFKNLYNSTIDTFNPPDYSDFQTIMKQILVFCLLLSTITSQAIQSFSVIVGFKNFGKQFTLNGIINPEKIAVLRNIETSFDLEVSTTITLENTNVKFVAFSRVDSFSYASLIYQLLIISSRPHFQAHNNLMLTYQNPEINVTSIKKLKSMPIGSGGDITVRAFVTAWSSLIAMSYTPLVGSYDSVTGNFTLTAVLADIPKSRSRNSWISCTVLLIGQSLIPECPDSVYVFLPSLFGQTKYIPMVQNFTYLLGVTQLFDFWINMRYIELNSTMILKIGWSSISVGYLAINHTCYAQVAGEMSTLSFLERWKVIVIAVVVVGGILSIVGLVFFCKWLCSEEEENEDLPQQSNVNLKLPKSNKSVDKRREVLFFIKQPNS